MRQSRTLIRLTLLLLSTGLAFGQATKKNPFTKGKEKFRSALGRGNVTLPFQVPPEQDLPLRRLIIITPKDDEHAKNLKDAAAQYFVQQKGVDILDRDSIKNRHEERLFIEAQGKSQHAIAWGKEHGASAMINIKSVSIEYEQSAESNTNIRAFLRTVIQAINLETGQVFGQRTLSIRKSPSFSSRMASTNTGLKYGVIDKAGKALANIFIPHVQERVVPFKKKGREFNQQQAYDALDSGDLEYARELAYEGYEKALNSNAKAKKRAAACYNAGLLMLCEGRFDEAVKALRKANELDRADLYRETAKMARELRSNQKKTSSMGFKEANAR